MKILKHIVYLFIGVIAILGITLTANAQTYNIGVYMSYRGPVNKTTIWRAGDIWTPRGVPYYFQHKQHLFDTSINVYGAIEHLLDNDNNKFVRDRKLKQLVYPHAIKKYVTSAIKAETRDALEQYYKNIGHPFTVRFF